MEEGALSMKKKMMIPGGWQIQKEVSVTKHHLDFGEYAIEEKEKIPGGCNSHMEANKTKCDSGRVERMRRRRECWFLVDGIVRRTSVTPNMILGEFKASWRGQR